ncbi:MAG: hypothetical protein KDJ52_22000 [Anaerolineae bacterium]|nr:hypothetical protein [Anaerolineae bacterium]
MNALTQWHIDSSQKLYFLLFLHNHPRLKGTGRELAEQAFLGDTPQADRIIADLQQLGLLDRVDNAYRLRETPEIKAGLQELARAFEQPLIRQKMLATVRHREYFVRYRLHGSKVAVS